MASSQEERLQASNVNDAAAHAPEADNAALAPEYRGDNVPPEVSTASGKQAFYNSSPPEAVISTNPTDVGKEHVDEESKSRGTITRKKIIVVVVIAVVLAVIVLAVGLGVGLSRRGNHDTNKTAVQNSASSTGAPIATATPSTVPQKNSILDDTSFAAVSLPNGDRRVVFQEQSGNIRQAIYSSQAKTWGTDSSDNFQLTGLARNKSPLAVTTHGDVSPDTWTLFYVTTEGNLTCILMRKDPLLLPKHPRCWIFENATMPSISVAADSRHISASLVANTTGTDIILTYQNHAQNINILHLSWLNGTTAKYGNETGWRATNVTRKFEYAVQLGSIGDDWNTTRLAGTCYVSHDSDGPNLNCFSKGGYSGPNYHWYTMPFSIDSPTKLEVDLYSASGAYREYSSPSQSDYCVLAGGETLGFNGTDLMRIGYSDNITASKTPFAYQRIGSTFAANTTESYIYHQVNGSTFVEEVWDQNGFWLPGTNVTIQVE